MICFILLILFCLSFSALRSAAAQDAPALVIRHNFIINDFYPVEIGMPAFDSVRFVRPSSIPNRRAINSRALSVSIVVRGASAMQSPDSGLRRIGADGLSLVEIISEVAAYARSENRSIVCRWELEVLNRGSPRLACTKQKMCRRVAALSLSSRSNSHRRHNDDLFGAPSRPGSRESARRALRE